MKKYTLTLFVIFFLIFLFSLGYRIAESKSKKEYNRMEGFYLKKQQSDSAALKSYQIKTTQDSIIVYDYNRRVSAMPYDSSQFSGIIMQDNQ